MTASLGDLGVLPPAPHLPQKDRLPGKLALELLERDINDRQLSILNEGEKMQRAYVGESNMGGRGRWRRGIKNR